MTQDQSPDGLLARLEAAESGGGELDCRIEKAVGLAVALDGAGRAVAGDGTRYRVPAYTTSLDAALALAERLGFGDCFDIQMRPRTARVQRFDGAMDVWRTTEDCATAPLALCAALLRATGQSPASNTGGGA